MIEVVSTKILTPAQKALLNPEIFRVKDFDFIAIEGIEFELSGTYDHLIFTSQNAVTNYFIGQKEVEFTKSISCYCVGEKTKAVLEKNGQKVIKMAQNSAELGHFLIKNYKNEHFLYVCGNLSRRELPELLKAASIPLTRLEVYRTKLTPQEFAGRADVLLFFSPSGVESFALKHPFGQATAFCIGKTTAEAARKFTDKIEIAENQTVESVLAHLAAHSSIA